MQAGARRSVARVGRGGALVIVEREIGTAAHLARIFDAWGFERCLWGTDWTRAFAVVNYEQGVKPFLETKRLSDSERAMLMGGACAKAYGWSPKER